MRTVFRDDQKRLRNGWKILGAFVLMALGAAGLIFVRRLLPADARRLLPEPHLAFLGAFLGSWLCLRLEGQPLASLGLAPSRRLGRDFGLGLLGGVALMGLVALAVRLAGGYHLVRVPDAGVALLLKGAWTMLGVALFEETLFHGYIFQRARRGLGSRGAQVALAVVFCLAHPFSPGMGAGSVVLAMLTTFLAGLMLGLCFLRTGRLALPVGVHMGWNWSMGSLGFGVSGNASTGGWAPVLHGPEWLTGGGYGLEASAVSVAVLALAVVVLARWKGVAAEPGTPRASGSPALGV